MSHIDLVHCSRFPPRVKMVTLVEIVSFSYIMIPHSSESMLRMQNGKKGFQNLGITQNFDYGTSYGAKPDRSDVAGIHFHLT